MIPEQKLDSFVLRFVQDEEASDQLSWRGLIRHVQSNREHHFTCWEEAVAFIAQYVDVESGKDAHE